MISENPRVCRYFLTLPLALALAGCATRQVSHPPVAPSSRGDASWHMVQSENAAHYQLRIGEVASGASLENQAVPAYPPALLATCGAPEQVQALLIVDKSGHVDEVRVAGEIQSPESRRLFIASVRAAALQWKFLPLQFQRWTDDADGGRHAVSTETRPFSAEYVFRFECHAGRAEVSTGQAGNH